MRGSHCLNDKQVNKIVLKLAELPSGLVDKAKESDTSTCCSHNAPLIVAQEALIALTNKFTPIEQWMHQMRGRCT